MSIVTLEQAQTGLADLIHGLRPGQVVMITENARPVAQLTPAPAEVERPAARPRPPVTGTPQAGRLKGLLAVPADLDEPLAQSMTQVTVTEAQERLPDLLATAEAGDAVLIKSDAGRAFQLTVPTPVPSVNPAWPGYPHAGSAKGLIQVADDFDDPVDELKDYME